jgi:hypothetical protein
MTGFDISRLDSAMLTDLGHHYEEEGYCVLDGLNELVTGRFYPVLAETIGVTHSRLAELLEPRSSEGALPQEFRRKLSRIATAPQLANDLLHALKPVLKHLLGPLVHVSTNFHAQFKSKVTGRVGYGGYDSQSQFMEVHGAYQLHQDFTGASLPTSPSGLTLWAGLNKCSEWPIRLYPRSHKLGLLCQQFVPLDHERLAQLSTPVDIQAEPGTAVIFNALVLHGTGEGNELRRVSADIRFFPSCGYLPTRTHALTDSPCTFIQESLAQAPGPTRRAPLLENLALAGNRSKLGNAPRFSILNWANYLDEACNGQADRAVFHLERFANTEVGMDAPEVYVSKFHGRPMEPETLQRIRDLMSAEQAFAGGRS